MKATKHVRASSALRTGRRRLAVITSMALIAAAFALVSAPAVSAAPPPGPYFNGFEHVGDTATWPDAAEKQAMFDVNRVASGTNGITSSAGSFHADAPNNDAGNLVQLTRMGGYSSTFPTGGYTTSIDIYLNMSIATGSNDLRFDWSSAINDTVGAHRRDFVFSVGTSNVANEFVMSASNNSSGWPANPDRYPFKVATSGWYTFQHRFYDAGEGVLAVDLSILDSEGTALHTWTLSDSTDIIGTTVGGNRYGWLVTNHFPSLALDNITRSGTALSGCAVAITTTPAVVTYTLLENCTTDHTVVVPQNLGTGNSTVFDGNGYSITGVDPAGGHFLGAVIQAATGGNAITVENLTVTVSNLQDACDAGTGALRGILYDGVPGTITNDQVIGIKQGTNSGCQEGNGIDVRNTAAVGKPSVLVSGNTVSDYQKTGILANGSVAATIQSNTVTGAGQINYIAQNGIQVSRGATASVKLNSSSGNYYTPTSYVACGFLIYQASGVKASSNTFFNNEKNQCNFGKGGGTFKPAP